MLIPFLMMPVLHVRVWGGTKLQAVFGKHLPDDQPYGESWEVHDTAIVANGEYAGKTLGSLVDELGAAIVGEGNNPAEGMPLLLKILDAEAWLSVQVHPNDDQAKQLEGDPRGKSEAWIVLQADPNAQIINGLKAGTTRDQIREAITSGSLEQYLSFIAPRTGDILYLPANTVHALGAGLLIYEIQQSSDITYRLYDWNRVGVDGKPRTLHIEKGVTVANLDARVAVTHPADAQELILESPYFVTYRHLLTASAQAYQTHGKFQFITCINGSATVAANGTQVAIQHGQTVFLAAGISDYTLSGAGIVLRSCQPT